MALAEGETTELRHMPMPYGPALVYVSENSGPHFTMTTLDQADLASMPARDRAICRALLSYVLAQLDEADSGLLDLRTVP